jgi:hypothetical protein
VSVILQIARRYIPVYHSPEFVSYCQLPLVIVDYNSVIRRMPSSEILRCAALARTDVSEKRNASIIRLTSIGELGRAHWLLVTANVPSSSILVTLIMEMLRFSETSVLRRLTLCNIQGDGILPTHRRGNLKSYISLNPVPRKNFLQLKLFGILMINLFIT